MKHGVVVIKRIWSVILAVALSVTMLCLLSACETKEERELREARELSDTLNETRDRAQENVNNLREIQEEYDRLTDAIENGD